MITSTFWHVIGFGMCIVGLETMYLIWKSTIEELQQCNSIRLFILGTVFPIVGLALALGVD